MTGSTGWQAIYNDGTVRTPSPRRETRACPKTWPHPTHTPWFDDTIRPASAVVSFTCPGVPANVPSPEQAQP